MIELLLIQKNAPDITNILLVLLAVLLVMLGIDTLFRWLKTKPWKKKEIIDQAQAEDVSPDNRD